MMADVFGWNILQGKITTSRRLTSSSQLPKYFQLSVQMMKKLEMHFFLAKKKTKKKEPEKKSGK